jgi:hypothetical protein
MTLHHRGEIFLDVNEIFVQTGVMMIELFIAPRFCRALIECCCFRREIIKV